MKSTLLIFMLAPGILAAQTMPVQSNAQRPRYTVRDLGVLGTGDNASGFGINNFGWVAGSSNRTSGGPQHAFVWFGGGPFIDIGTLGGAACPSCNSGASVPNAFGEVELGSDTAALDPLGQDFGADGTHHQVLAAVWRNGKLTALPTLPGGNNANALGINIFGQVIGFSEDGVHDASCLMGMPFQVTRYQAVIWEPYGAIKRLPPLTQRGDTVAFGFGINNSGQAVGSSGLCSNVAVPPGVMGPHGPHAVLWEADGTAIDILGNQGGVINVASSINNRGEVAGGSVLADGTGLTWVWSRQTGKQNLPLLSGASFAVAPCCNTINDRREIAGFSIDASGPRAIVWLDENNQAGKASFHVYDLNTLVPANQPLYLLFGESINEAGEITGQGCVMPACTVLHAFVATPSKVRVAGESPSSAPENVSRPMLLPENVRRLFRDRFGIGVR